ncbi:hypothetical protein JX266_004664 [Neoarthrinium moseri]|nr:hypothetical protein JX266_004664 [Neoarthrinium moseri]
MPLYEVEHIAPLTRSQKDELAAAITDIHSKKFTTPRLFVNIKFTDAWKQDTYVAGNARPNNRIRAQVRRGPTRMQDDFNALAAELVAAWARIVHPLHRDTSRPPLEPELELRGVWITGEIISSWETGFLVPPAGKDVEWARENMAAFKKRAANGEQEFKDLVHELESRPEFQV